MKKLVLGLAVAGALVAGLAVVPASAGPYDYYCQHYASWAGSYWCR